MFEPRLALASLSGRSDAEWARSAEAFAGAAFLGGIALDGPTREAARAMVDREREEFLPDDPVAFVDRQLAALADADLRPGVNVRTTSLGPLREVAEVCADHGAMLELNAHCRQDEMCDAGAGEALLRDPDRLLEQVEAAAGGGEAGERGPAVSVKVRAELPGVDLSEIAEVVADAGGDAVHVDAMDSEEVIADVADVAESSDLFVIANNEVRDATSVREYLDYGADAVSVGRPSDDPAVLRRVRSAVDEWFAEHDRDDGEKSPEDGAEVRA
ncbi:tRNA-dihydrouridine synthase [Halorussus rarus]|uniref:tRNA-dihydrouridine synthase n=1 Tax=Halorussus TaxID=1070314 RepID=UPI000E218C4C|nr:tRNA-dihydrouridine synthase [Halorussus rarus]NHN59323.1 dihydropyrimidine dehydrogenase [Halorussus sp. JP-T4]